MSNGQGISQLWKREDYWAIWLGLTVIIVAMAFFWAGGTIKDLAVVPGKWVTASDLAADLAEHWSGFLAVFLGFSLFFTVSSSIMGITWRRFLPGFVILFVGSLAIFYLAGHGWMKRAHIGAPLLALIIGLVIGNIRAMPGWFKQSLRTEYYIKTGIVLLGATLPLTLIIEAGPVAFLQATIVSVGTWSTIYFAATRLFKLDPRFGAVLGTGGAVCGVSGSIAVGGAVRAEKDHIAIGIAVVSVWAIVMILALTVVTKWLVPESMSPGIAGAWVGTSEYADAAGFAVVAELAEQHGDGPIRTFTLMKVIGRDIWIGIWAFVLSIVSVTFWEKRKKGETLPIRVVWDRFPKFVLGFFAASIIMSAIAANPPADHVGSTPWSGTFKSKAQKQDFEADFSDYTVPEKLVAWMRVDEEARTISFKGKMSQEEFDAASAACTTRDQRIAIKELEYRSNWFESRLKSKAISPIKKLRSWAFVICFLCIGLSTRFKELITFGLKPFWAFTIGVAVNVPLGYFLSSHVFASYWSAIK
jgi:uncharacterized membrane protein YadS